MVSFETALKLEEAGFRKPSPSFGQIWYEHKYPVMVGNKSPMATETIFSAICGNRTRMIALSDFDKMVFAPTAIDILKKLWFRFEIKFGGQAKWLVLCRGLNDEYEVYGENENPSEAAASAWLKENSK